MSVRRSARVAARFPAQGMYDGLPVVRAVTITGEQVIRHGLGYVDGQQPINVTGKQPVHFFTAYRRPDWFRILIHHRPFSSRIHHTTPSQKRK
jgi:hypothetical protein